jgi:hypothetical protein
MTNARRFSPRALIVAAALVGAVSASKATAQGPTFSIVPGTRVRVSAQNMVAPLVANFLAMRGDTAVFIEEGGGKGIWTILTSEIRKIERSDGERLSNRPYMMRGVAIGAGVGLLGGLVFANNASPGDASREYNQLGVGAIGAVLGGVIGGAIGSRRAVEKWTNVPIRRVAIAPTGRGGLTASLHFAF